MKKNVFLLIALAVASLASAQWDGTTATQWTQGNGTQANPYQISSPEHLAYLSQSVNAGNGYQNKYFLLTQDISLSNMPWTPIGSDTSHAFRGTFDGGGYTIDSIYTAGDSSLDNVGLLGVIRNGAIMNTTCKINIAGAYYSYNSYLGCQAYIGGIVAWSINSSISNCTTFGEIAGNLWSGATKMYVGGIVGYSENTSVSYCTNHCNIDANGGYNNGGIAGYAGNTSLSHCTNHGNIIGGNSCAGIAAHFVNIYNNVVNTINITGCTNYGTISGAENTAGLIGRTESHSSDYWSGVGDGIINITKSGNHGILYCSTMPNGGIVAYTSSSTYITQCYNRGDLYNYGGSWQNSGVGGIAGHCNYTYQINYCYNTGVIRSSHPYYWSNGANYPLSIYGISWQVGTGVYNAGAVVNTGSSDVFLYYGDSISNFLFGIGEYCASNDYYLNTASSVGCGTPLPMATMKGSSFPAMLNVDSTVYVMDALGINGGYPVFTWQTPYNVTTNNVSNVTSYAACLNGHHDGIADSTGFVYWPIGSDDSIVVPIAATGTLQHQITGLQPGIMYGYRFYVKFSGHTVYGDTVMFNTHPLYTVNVASSNTAWGTATGGGTFAYDEQTILTATPTSANYRFFQWNDGNTNNPRVYMVTNNVNLTAQFGLSTFTVTVASANSAQGSVSGGGSFEYGQQTTVTATANTGYHFMQWSDGSTSNPRTVVVESDMYLTAYFAPNNYNVTLLSNNSQWGSVAGGGTYTYGTAVTLTATPNGNFIFAQWSDGSTENPRNLVVTSDTTLTAQFSPGNRTLTLLSNNNAWGTVSGGGTYAYGTSVTCTAIPAEHYHFVSWDDGNTSNPRAYILNGNATLTATFAPDNYTVTVQPNNSTWGTVTGSGTYAYGSIDTLTATPFASFLFVQWSDGNTENPRHFLVSGDTTLTAQFSPGNCTLTLLSNNNAWGTVSDGGTFAYGTSVTCTATPAEHYHFVSWDDGNTSNPRAYILTGNATLTATFAPDEYTVTVQPNNSSWGSVSGGGTYAYNTIDTLRATPFENYVFEQWSDNVTENPRLVTVTGDTAFTAQFALRTYLVMVSSNNAAWGSVVGGGTFTYGQTTYCTAIPESGYHFTQWNDGNTSNPRIVTADSNISLTAIFAPNQYTITVTSSDTTKGTVSGGGTYDYNQQIYIIAIPEPSYSFSQWSDGNTDAYRQITVTQNISYIAVFSDAYFTVTAVSNNDAYGYVTGGGSHANGSTVTLTAVANPGYHFEQWSDGVTDNPRIVTVTSNITYYAQFAVNTYNINVVSNDPAMGSVTGGGIYTYLTSVTLQATPAQNHRFVQWSDGITSDPRVITVTSDSSFTALFEPIEQFSVTVVSNDPTRGTVSGGGTFFLGDQTDISATPLSNNVFSHWSDGSTESHRTVTVTDNVTYTAYFEATRHQVNVYSNDDNLGTVNGEGSYEHGASATVTATPADGCRFVRWNNGVEANPYTFTVYSDVNLIANFERTTGIGEVESGEWRVESMERSMRVVGAEGQAVAVYDALGRQVYTSRNYQETPIALPAAGVYMVRVNGKVKKLVAY